MGKQSPRTGLSIVLKVSILAGSIAAVASLIVGSLIVSGSSDIVYQDALDRLKYETNIKSIKLVSDIKNLSGDAQYLVGTPPIQGVPRAIKNGGIDPQDNSDIKTWKHRLATIFSELIRAKPSYLQIRYIGIAENGRELVRADRKGSLIKTIPDGKLQQKGDTSYFKNSIKMHPGEIYLSDISLNKEFGKISEPHTPVIRASAPVYFNDKLFGILVINMAFGGIFDELVINTPRELIPYVTNEEGYFLAHPDRSMTYGFDHGTNYRIQSTYPDFELQKEKDLRDIEFTVESNGDVVHVVKTFYDPTHAERFFAVMLATSKHNLQAKSDQLRNQSFLIMGLLVIASLIVAAVMASKLMRPLKLISIASEDLAHGREISDLPVEAGGEIGELARSFDNMRHQLEDKEHELIVSQGRVHHANKMASLGEMAAGMAHEINSPIQTISLIAHRVQRQLKNNMSEQEIHDSMEKVSESVEKITELIDSLRKVSRDSTEDNFVDIRLRDLVKDAINMTGERFKVKNIRFDIHYHDISENIFIQCQRLQISQVLINLLNNAHDAVETMENKWIRIDITTLAEKIQISVTDSGAGIPDEIVDRIFEPMYTTKDVGKGTGLGLSISRDIISKHHGLLYVNKESANTCFVIELPIVHTSD